MSAPIKYIPDDSPYRPAPFTGHDGRNASGYGSRIRAAHQVFVEGLWRRVYAICWSNAASHFVNVKGEKFFISWVTWPEPKEGS